MNEEVRWKQRFANYQKAFKERFFALFVELQQTMRNLLDDK